ncbi:MAG TPA: pyruvate ferredoxin oxidoreductase [Firmicutes bacterium]|nr:pyruvate ferredoxin oxidoreductase [Bacillota bacterium]
MKKVILGDHAVSYGALLSRVQTIAAYPITPQTLIVERLSEMTANGELKAIFTKVESEHSAMASTIGSSASGARAFTATSAQGLALMHEMLHWAAGARLPIVMANVNRAMAPGWTIWTDQNDSLSARDVGWMQIYCQDNQEVLDSIILGYKVSEQVNLPTMVILDAFVLSHTAEGVDVPDIEEVDKFLPPYKPEIKMDINDPRSFGALTSPDVYMEFRYKMQQAMDKAKEVIVEEGKKFGDMFGRKYGLVEEYKTEDADTILIASATVASTAKAVIDEMREAGLKVGLLRIRVFRPFPTEEVIRVLNGRKKVVVIDRNISFGKTGIFFDEVKGAFYNSEGNKPPMFGYIAGLGGRDVTPKVIKEIMEDAIKKDKPESEILWKGVKL